MGHRFQGIVKRIDGAAPFFNEGLHESEVFCRASLHPLTHAAMAKHLQGNQIIDGGFSQKGITLDNGRNRIPFRFIIVPKGTAVAKKVKRTDKKQDEGGIENIIMPATDGRIGNHRRRQYSTKDEKDKA